MVLNEMTAGVAPITALVKAVTENEWGKAKPYLVGIKRALLARQDFKGAFGGATSDERTARQAASYKNLLRSARIDPALWQGFLETVAPRAVWSLAKQGVSQRSVSSPRLAISDPIPLSSPSDLARALAVRTVRTLWGRFCRPLYIA
jgi:hypothetical protein